MWKLIIYFDKSLLLILLSNYYNIQEMFFANSVYREYLKDILI